VLRALLFSLALTAALVTASSAGSARPDNPLPPCPDSPNCERTTRTYTVDPDSLFSAAQSALSDLGPVQLTVESSDRRAHAVYRVALIFKDDVDIAVTPHEKGSALHIRSASRVGHSDLGVNARRVRRFFRALGQQLATVR
jgi:uncharacterized protein (DUF1499 family)